MRNFEKDLEVATEEDLRLWVNQRDFRVVPLASDELTRRKIAQLQSAIENNTSQAKKFAKASIEFNKRTSEQSAEMIKMTRTMRNLTVVMAIGLVLQIALALLA